VPVFLYIGYFVTRFPPTIRKAFLIKVLLGMIAAGVGYKLGVFDFLIVQILGKSTDLTGRADFWPIILENFYKSGSSLLGGGFGVNIGADISEWSVDNGYIDKFLEFGYLFSPIIFATLVAVLWLGIRAVITTSRETASTNIFPLAIWSVILIVNITESNFMTKCLSTVITSIAVGISVQQRTAQLETLRDEAKM
jgi:exopolysaccharide production protein ExoQ